MKQIPGKIMAIVGSLAASAAIAAFAYQNNSAEQTRIEIERLHQLDVEATLSDKADELAKLWDRESSSDTSPKLTTSHTEARRELHAAISRRRRPGIHVECADTKRVLSGEN